MKTYTDESFEVWYELEDRDIQDYYRKFLNESLVAKNIHCKANANANTNTYTYGNPDTNTYTIRRS